MFLKPTTLAVLSALVLGAGLSGCGGQAKDFREAQVFSNRVNMILEDFNADLERFNVTKDNRKLSPAEAKRAANRLKRRILGVQKEIAEVGAPPSLKPSQAALVAAFDNWTDPLTDYVKAIDENDISATIRAKSRFDSQGADVETRLRAAREQAKSAFKDLSD